MPTNENDEFPNYLRTGVYEKVSPSRACLSNAMNVGHPSNLARFFELYGGTVDRNRDRALLPRSQGDAQAHLLRQRQRRRDEEDHPERL